MADWYYVERGERRGPVPFEELAQLVAAGSVTGDTLVWNAVRGGNWTAARHVPELASLGFGPPPAQYPPPTEFSAPGLGTHAAPSQIPYYSDKAAMYSEEGLRSLFRWYWILIGPLFIFCLPPIAGAVLYYILLYRHWVLIQDGRARTTPGVAVGFCFIPFFNLYWVFVAKLGLAQDMNAYIRRYGIPAQPVNEKLALWVCILTLCSILPYLNYLAFLVNIVLTILVTGQMNDVAIAILRARRASALAAQRADVAARA